MPMTDRTARAARPVARRPGRRERAAVAARAQQMRRRRRIDAGRGRARRDRRRRRRAWPRSRPAAPPVRRGAGSRRAPAADADVDRESPPSHRDRAPVARAAAGAERRGRRPTPRRRAPASSGRAPTPCRGTVAVGGRRARARRRHAHAQLVGDGGTSPPSPTAPAISSATCRRHLRRRTSGVVRRHRRPGRPRSASPSPAIDVSFASDRSRDVAVGDPSSPIAPPVP